MSARWYVYRVQIGSELVYIGKGTGIRYLLSARRLNGIAGILEFFDRERAALKREKELIAKLKPPLNRTAGGEGKSRIRRPSDAAIEHRWEREIYERAVTTGSPVDILIAVAWAKCRLNDLRRTVNG